MSRGQDGLMVSLEARVNQFERQMQRAANSNNRAMAQIERRSSMAMRSLNTSVAMGANQASAALGALGVQAGNLGAVLGAGGIWAGAAAATVGYVAALRRVSSEVAQIGARADRIGVATEELQRLRFASEQAAGSARAVDEGLDRFAKGISDAARGTGELYQILQANNVALTDADGKLRSTSDLFRAYADLVKNAANENDQLAIAITAFGRSAGPELVGLLRQGAAGVDELAQAADNAGVVLNDEIVRRAQEIDDKFSQIVATVGTSFKEAVLDVAGAVKDLLGLLEKIRPLLEQYERIQASVPGFLRGGDPIGNTARSLAEGIRSGAVTEFFRPTRDAELLKRELFEIEAALARPGVVGGEAARDRLIREREALLEEIKRTQEVVDVVKEVADEVKAPENPTILPPSSGGGGGGGKRSAAERLNDYQREVEAIQRRTQALTIDAQATALSQMEADKLRASTELLNAAREAGVAITPELKAQVEQLSGAYAEQAELVRNLEKAQQEMQQVAGMVADGMTDVFTGIITGAKNAEQAIGQLLQQLGRLLINRAFTALINSFMPGGGGLPGRAAGGPVNAGQAYTVGEFGRETFVPTTPGRIIPAGKGGGGGTVVNIHQTIAANGDKTIAEIAAQATQQGLRSYDRGLSGRIAEINMRTG